MIYHIQVKPHSNKDEVVKEGDQLIVRTRKKPHDGEANDAVIKLLSEYFSVPKTKIIIKAGAKSKHKTIEVLN